MGMKNICRSYWETFPLFPGGKDNPSHWETFLLPLPTGKGFVLPLVNISHFYLKRVSTPTLKLSPFPVGNICDACGFVTTDKKEFELHLDEVKRTCPVCKKDYDCVDYMKEH